MRAEDGTIHAARSPSTGTLIEVSVERGDYLDVGRPVALIDPDTQQVVVYAYLPQADAKRARVGDRVEIASSVAVPSEYGFRRGHVATIGSYPATQERLISILRDRSIKAKVNELGPVVEALVLLDRDRSTPSGLSWSTGDGPPYRLTIGEPVDASIVTGEQAPIDYVTGWWPRPRPMSRGSGGCLSRALARTATIHARDEHNCVVTRRINPELAADIAEGRLVPEPGWLPFSSSLTAAESGRPRLDGRLAA